MQVEVESTYLEKVACDIEQEENVYRQAVQELFEQVSSLSQAWQGEDNLAFVRSINSYKNDLEKIAIIMNQYINFLSNSAKAYQETQANLKMEAEHLWLGE